VVIAFTAIVILVMLALHLLIDVKEPLSALFYFANYLYADDHPRTGPFMIFWSLSIEEHFYLLLPAFVVLLRGNPRRLLVVMGLVCLGERAFFSQVRREMRAAQAISGCHSGPRQPSTSNTSVRRCSALSQPRSRARSTLTRTGSSGSYSRSEPATNSSGCRRSRRASIDTSASAATADQDTTTLFNMPGAAV
jgi:hypothetical protein